MSRGKISTYKRDKIYKRDNCICQYCGKMPIYITFYYTDTLRGIMIPDPFEKYSDFELDHIIPVSRGGNNDYCNLITACRKCNSEKSNKLNYAKSK